MQKKTKYGASVPNFAMSNFKDNVAHDDTMNIVEFFYPTFPATKRRYPLTRCLLGALVESIKCYEPKEDHNFGTVIEYLNDILKDINNPEKTEKQDKLDVLNKLFYPDDYTGRLEYRGKSRLWQDIKLPEWAVDMFELFYYYDKLDSQQYTVACLLYDLIPYKNVSFEEIGIAIENNRSANELIDFQKKTAMWKGDNATMALFKIREVANKLFSPTDVIRQSAFQLAAFSVLEKQDSLDLDFPVKSVRKVAMHAYTSGRLYCDDGMDTPVHNTARLLMNIFESSASRQGILIHVVERLFDMDMPLKELLPSGQAGSPDGFFF